MPSTRNTRDALERLLHQRNEHPERLGEIDREIWDAFGETHAVWVMDMCGFSRLTVRHGITHFLAMIQRLHGVVRPIVARHGGAVVKTEADNVFAVFADVGPAVAAAQAVQAELDTANVFLPEDWDLHASIGIGYGEILMVGDHDFYGNELNIASKLGEDVAGPGETYLTEAAHARLGVTSTVVATDGGVTLERCDIPISAMIVAAYRLTS
jgi:class 3 adenylate cyclase